MFMDSGYSSQQLTLCPRMQMTSHSTYSKRPFSFHVRSELRSYDLHATCSVQAWYGSRPTPSVSMNDIAVAVPHIGGLTLI
jgi:hypothetical protein